MDKTLCALVLVGMCFQHALAETISEDEVLKAAFRIFQPQGIFSAKEIQESMVLLYKASEQGDELAQMVIDPANRKLADKFIISSSTEKQ